MPLSTSQKLLLLQSAVAQPFTTKAALLAFLASRYPQIDCCGIEAFLEEVIDFGAVEEREGIGRDIDTAAAGTTDTTVAAEDNDTTAAGTEDSNNDSDTNTVSDTNTSITNPATSPPPSPTSPLSPAILIAPTPSPPPPHLVPVRTPSGRTLRSNSTVNTTEPRRLRSNK